MEISGEDFREGLISYCISEVPGPNLKVKPKVNWGNSKLWVWYRIVGCTDGFSRTKSKKKLRRIIDKVILAATARHAARKAREMVQRKNVLTGGGLPGKLVCSSRSAEES